MLLLLATNAADPCWLSFALATFLDNGGQVEQMAAGILTVFNILN